MASTAKNRTSEFIGSALVRKLRYAQRGNAQLSIAGVSSIWSQGVRAEIEKVFRISQEHPLKIRSQGEHSNKSTDTNTAEPFELGLLGAVASS